MEDLSYMIYGAIIAILWIIFSIWFAHYNDKREIKINEKYFDLILKCLNNNTFNEENLFRIIKDRNDNLYSIFWGYNFSKEKFLDSFLLYIIKHDSDGNITQKSNELIKPIIQRIKEENLFSNVNGNERLYLLSIHDTMKKSVNLAEIEKSNIEKDLEGLSVAIEENQDALEKCMKTNKWSKPVSVIGVLLTLIFGIIQLIQSCSSH